MRIIWIIVVLVMVQVLDVPVYGMDRDSFELEPHRREIVMMGFTRPKQVLKVSAEISGRVSSIVVDVGDPVGRDGSVATLDSTFITLDMQQNRLKQQELARRLALEQKNLARYTSLIAKNSTDQATYDRTLAETEVLNLQLQQLEVEQARLREQFKRYTLRAPPGWLVIKRYAEAEEYIRLGEPLLEVGDFGFLLVSLALSPMELRLLQEMEVVRLKLPDVPLTVNARIYRVSPDIDPQTRKIGVDLVTMEPEEDPRLRGGLRVRVVITGKVEEKTFVVPMEAISSRYESHWLTGVNGDQVRIIIIGNSPDGSGVVITGDELRAGDRFRVNDKVSAEGME